MYDLHVRNSHYVWTYYTIKESAEKLGILNSNVRRYVRYLKKHGYVEYLHAYSEDDNLVNGSGHIITAKGIRYIQELP